MRAKLSEYLTNTDIDPAFLKDKMIQIDPAYALPIDVQNKVDTYAQALTRHANPKTGSKSTKFARNVTEAAYNQVTAELMREVASLK